MKELFPTGKSTIPLITNVLKDQLLLARGHISIFISYDGRPTRTYGLRWSEGPLAIGYYFPYVIAILPKYLEVRTMFGTDTHVQTMTMQRAKQIKVRGDVIYVASINRIWRLQPIPILDQIDQLCRDGFYDKAITILENIPQMDKQIAASKLKAIRKRYSFHLFSKGEHERAMTSFFNNNFEPLEVIGLYPDMLPKNYKKFEYPVIMPEIMRDVLPKALEALINYLTDLRIANTTPKDTVHIDYADVKDVATIIDTTLLKAYAITKNPSLQKLLALPNSCHVKESQRVLIQYQKYSELVLLYRGKQMHRTALELLGRLGQGPRKGSTLHGVGSTIQYLKHLSKEHTDLILEFSKWVLQASPKEGLTLFTERKDDELLNPQKVMTFLQEVAPVMATPYLEFIIHSKGETGAEFHNQLLFHYLSRVLALKKDVASPNPDVYQKAGTEPGLLGKMRKKMLAFLEQSESYDPNKMLPRFMFAGSDLYEERAILLSRIQNHRQALELYVYKIKDFALAEEYCELHYHPVKESDVYLSLMEVYLKPPDNEPRQLEPAFILLNKRHNFINAAKALELLPPTTPIQILSHFLENVLREKTKMKRELQIEKNLLKLENLRVRSERIEARSKVIKIYNGRECPVCSKHIRGSVFAVYPNGVVVHFMCAQDKNICPVTGVDFRKSVLSS
eukprot:TRINITY_DN8476_c0_g1_i1.p1 TRINITY_DN8476_c0_g1~~TRINITY_DN8476_c0_g1_i1.p1  ORF type:complete len:678 (+),score=95.53 TRINITY_DN8476_c0_g1_i1:189-2222(+)